MTHRPSFRPPRVPLLLAAGALLLSGCGLSEYAGQMASESVRVQAWDEEAKLVGNPLKMPELPKKDDVAPKWKVFLRPPLGVSDSPVAQKDSSLAQLVGPLAQYVGGRNQFGVQNLYLGVAVEQKDFPSAVCGQFPVNPSGDTSITIPRSPTLINSFATGKAGANEVLLKLRTAEGQASTYRFYFYEHGNVEVAVVFQIDKSSAQKAEPAIKASLSTLAEGSEAEFAASTYRKWNTKPRR